MILLQMESNLLYVEDKVVVVVVLLKLNQLLLLEFGIKICNKVMEKLKTLEHAKSKLLVSPNNSLMQECEIEHFENFYK